MKKICLVNGSLRGKDACSTAFLSDVERKLSDAEYEKRVVTVRAKVKGSYPEDVLDSLAAADALVLCFPLYNYGLPGALMRLLEDYYQFRRAGKGQSKRTSVYAVVNCGFPRPEITAEAVRVLKSFCGRLSLHWRFAVRIGTGPVVVATRKVPFLDLKLKRAFADVARDLATDGQETRDDYLIRPALPAGLIALIKKYYEEKGHMIPKDDKRPAGDLRQVRSPNN